jgi:RNA polymerase sigma factor (sigma-70 family)
MNVVMSGASPVPPNPVSWTGTEAVYQAAYRDLLRVAFLLTGSGQVAEDVVHDVFCRIGPRIAELENPPAYLRVAVVNQCRSLHRRFARAPRLEPPADATLDAGLVEMRGALQALPTKQRTAVVLRYLCDLPDAEIADIIGCRATTVRTLVFRGLAQLRIMLQEDRP